jgi:hypothetical protein
MNRSRLDRLRRDLLDGFTSVEEYTAALERAELEKLSDEELDAEIAAVTEEIARLEQAGEC